jgi:hypothetical protein
MATNPETIRRRQEHQRLRTGHGRFLPDAKEAACRHGLDGASPPARMGASRPDPPADKPLLLANSHIIEAVVRTVAAGRRRPAILTPRTRTLNNRARLR